MIELVAAGAALASRALLQAADAALLAVGEDELRSAHGTPRRVRWVLALKSDPEPTAAALRAAASGLLAFAAVACAIWVNGVLARAGIARASMSRATFAKSGCLSTARRNGMLVETPPTWNSASAASARSTAARKLPARTITFASNESNRGLVRSPA